jgi:hypothetical protein
MKSTKTLSPKGTYWEFYENEILGVCFANKMEESQP